MKQIATLVLLAFFSNLHGQETKFVLKKGSGFNEEFYVLKNDKLTKHGTYVKYRQPFGKLYVLIESGNYVNDEKHGLWETFHNSFASSTWNSIKDRGHYAYGKKNGLWTYYYQDTTKDGTSIVKFEHKRKIDSVDITIDQKGAKLKQAGMFLNDKRVGEWTSLDYQGNLIQKYNFSTSKLLFDATISDSLEYNTNRKPLYVGGHSCLLDFLYYNIDLKSFVNNVNKDSIYAVITFNIDEQRKTNNIAISSNSTNKAFKNELFRLITLTDDNWLPALKEGINTQHPYKIRIDIIRTEYTSTSRRWRSFFTILE